MGNISLLIPRHPDCIAYLEEYMPADAPRLGRGYGVENRYLGEILDDLEDQGFVEGDDYEVTE